MILFLLPVAINVTLNSASPAVNKKLMKKIVFDISTYNVYTVYLKDAIRGSQINAIQWKTVI